jgi:spermidine/putrescine transport system substrate-binding protein
MTAAYNGDAVRAIREDPELTYFVPREGSEIWIDNLVIPAAAPHADLAEKFVNFLLEPDIAARVANFNGYGTTNRESMPLIKPEDRNNPAIYPSPEIMSRLELVRDLGAATTLYDELWTEVKGE